MNKIIIYLIISDVLILSAFGLLAPIFAIFLNEGISGGSITAAGLASAIFLISKSSVQLPLSMFLDKKKSKIAFLLGGTLLIAIVPFIYLFSRHMIYIYFAQIVYGLGAAMAYPAWYSLFTMHIDKKHRGFEYSIWSTGVGIGTAIAAFVGAIIARSYGFKSLFLVTGIMSLMGMGILLLLSKRFIKDVNKAENYIFHHTKK